MSELGLKSQVIVEIGFEWMKKWYGTRSEWLSQILIKSIPFNSIIIRCETTSRTIEMENCNRCSQDDNNSNSVKSRNNSKKVKWQLQIDRYKIAKPSTIK